MRTGFNISRASDQGLCGKGVYFCTHPSSSFQKSHGRYAATSAAADTAVAASAARSQTYVTALADTARYFLRSCVWGSVTTCTFTGTSP